MNVGSSGSVCLTFGHGRAVRAIFALILGLSATTLVAQEAMQLDLREMSLEELMNVVVLPTKRALTLEKTPASVTVFTSRHMEAMGARYLSDVLSMVPGFDVRRYREPLNLFELRGIGGEFSERVLVMMDGVRLNDIYNGGIARTARRIRLDDVARVEIIRGPGSALYGTNAFAAVINVITKTGADVDGMRLSGEYGSYGSYGMSILGGRDTGRNGIQGFFYYGSGDGEDYDITADGVGREGRLNDSFEEFSGGLKFDIGSDFELSMRFGERSEKGFLTLSDLLGEETDSNTGSWASLGADYNVEITESTGWAVKLFGAFNRWGRVNAVIWPAEYGPAANPNGPYPDGMYGHPKFDDWRYGVDTYFNIDLGRHGLILGAAYETEWTENSDKVTNGPEAAPPFDGVFFTDERRRVFAVYAQYDGEMSDHVNVTAGVRYDRYDDFGDVINPRAGIVIAPSKRTFAKLIYGSAFRAPTFRELYSENPIVRGDPDNVAETLDSVELIGGWKLPHDGVATISLFFNSIDDVIMLGQLSPGISSYQNLGEMETRGVEAEVKAQLATNWDLICNYAHVSSTITRDNVEFDTPFIASDLANLMVTGRISNRVHIAASVQYRGERARDEMAGDPRPPVEDWFVANLHVRITDVLTRGLDCFLTTSNLFNDKHWGPSNYPPKVPGVVPDDIPYPGLRVVGGVSYTFDWN